MSDSVVTGPIREGELSTDSSSEENIEEKRDKKRRSPIAKPKR